MPSTTSSRIPWLVLFLALPWNGVAQDPTPYLAPRQDTPILAFIGLFDAQLTSCTSTSFNWVYSGPDASLSLFISNQSVSQDTTTVAPTALTDKRSIRSLHVRDTVDIPIASMISPTLDGFNLTSLAVSPGDYQLIAIVATVPPYLAYSPTFTVQQGSDTSCLTSSPSSSSSSSTSSFTLSFPTTTSDISTITSTVSSSASASTSSSIVAPIGAVSSTPVNKGAIAGGVVAGVIISLAVIAFYYFFSRHRRTRAHARAPTDSHPSNGAFDVGTASGGNIGGRWGGLGSVDSHAPLSDPKVQKPYVSTRHRASQDEINFYRSRSGSVPHGGYTGSPSEEKFGGSPPEEMVLSTMPYRSPSSNAHASKNNVRSYSTSSMAPSEHPRRGSQSQARRPSLDSSASHAQSPFATPPASSPISVSRSASTSAQDNLPRKTARKPVPSYIDIDSPASSATSPVSASMSPLSSPTPFADPPVIPPAAVSSGHYSTRGERESLKSMGSKKSRSSKSRLREEKDKSNGSSTNASSEELGRQELSHKNSFGPGGVEGKQLHYLIPDMPLGH